MGTIFMSFKRGNMKVKIVLWWLYNKLYLSLYQGKDTKATLQVKIATDECITIQRLISS